MTVIPLCPGCKTTAPTLALTDGLWCAQCGYLAHRNATGAMEFHAPVQARSNAMLREAIKPFAALLPYWDEEFPLENYPDRDTYQVSPHAGDATVADLRRLIAALDATEPPKEPPCSPTPN